MVFCSQEKFFLISKVLCFVQKFRVCLILEKCLIPTRNDTIRFGTVRYDPIRNRFDRSDPFRAEPNSNARIKI